MWYSGSWIGSSEGILDEQVVFGRRGTPAEDDIIVHIDVTLKNGQATNRPGPMAAHRVCDIIIQEIRNYLKKLMVGIVMKSMNILIK